jgi:small-conductance mechanosensitive channel
MRQNGAQKQNGVEHATAIAEPERPAVAPAEPVAPPEPPPVVPSSLVLARLAGGHGPMKSQATGSDARAERLVRQVRGELDELREAIGRIRGVPEELTALDLEAVADDPEAAATLPPVLLVRALLEQRERNRRLEKRLAKQRGRIEQLEDRVRDLKQERAWQRGRLTTLDDVIAALHANLTDFRLQRDTHEVEAPARPALDAPDEPAHLP